MPDTILNVLDISVLIALLISTLIGYQRRLSGEVANVIGFVFAAILVMSFMGLIAEQIAALTGLSPRAATFTAYIAVFVVTLLLVSLLTRVLGGIMKITVTKSMDHFLGALAGTLRALIIMYIITIGLLALPVERISRSTAENSFSGALVLRSLPYLLAEIEKYNEEELQPDIDESSNL